MLGGARAILACTAWLAGRQWGASCPRLRELGLPVGAQVLVAEAARNLRQHRGRGQSATAKCWGVLDGRGHLQLVADTRRVPPSAAGAGACTGMHPTPTPTPPPPHLVVPVKARHHEHLLEQLRRLRQRVPVARLDPARGEARGRQGVEGV